MVGSSQRGQSLIELLVAIGVGFLLFAGAATLVAPTLQINRTTSQVQVAAAFGQALTDNIRTFSQGSWNNILSLATTSANTYYLITSSSPFTATSGIESIQISTTTFTRYFYLNDLFRDSNGNVTSTASGNTYDPSTKQVTIVYDWTRGATTTINFDLTRNRTVVLNQANWVGGSGFSGPVTSTNAVFSASNNIDYLDTPGEIFVKTPVNQPAFWVADSGNNRLEGFSATGTYVTQFGSYGSGTGQFYNPEGIAVDSNGNIWVSDASNSRMEEFTSAGTYENKFGSAGTGTGQFALPLGATFDAGGNLWVVDDNNARIQELSATGTYESQFGQYGSYFGSFVHPHAIVSSGTNLWITDYNNHRVQEISATGTYVNEFGTLGSGNGEFNDPYGIAMDVNNNFWVTDSGNNRIEEFSATGTYESQFGSLGTSTGKFNYPSSIVIDSGGNMWITDANNNRVEEFSATGTYESQFGSSGSGTDQFNTPNFIANAASVQTQNTSGLISSSSAQHWAWNDSVGWIDFYNSSTVGVSSVGLSGYASSSIGDISLDCHTTRIGNICSTGGGGSSSTPYSYSRSITVSTSTSIASGTQTNFPMLVSSTLSSWEPVSNGGNIQNLCTAPNGGQEPCDLVFATSSANCGTGNLNFETESYTSSTGALVDWVSVPSLTAGSVIYACYGASTVSTDQSHPANTWNGNYIAVYHFANPTSTLNLNDSTLNGNNAALASGGYPGSASSTPGKMGGAVNINGSSYGIDAPYSGTLNLSQITMEAWVKSTALPAAWSEQAIIYGDGGANTAYQLVEESYGSTLYLNAGSALGATNYPAYPNEYVISPSLNTWYQEVGTYDGTNWRVYLNGVLEATVPSTGPQTLTNQLDIGVPGASGATYPTESWDGAIDEVRLSNIARTPSWLLTEYNNDSSPNTFYTIGSETSMGGGGGGTASSTYQVLNDGEGNLTGWAWNDAIGWISFCGGQSTTNCPGTTNYQTTIDSGGNFQGWAWNDDVGWIDFNCDNTGICGISNFEVETTWLPPASTSASSSGYLDSETFDTGASSGAQFNSLLWQGTQPSGATVEFQFAASNASSGPWIYTGPDGTVNTYYVPAGPGDSINLNQNLYNNLRYFRYAVYLANGGNGSPIVKNVVVNWSP